jgi:hypothetical protein
MPRFQVIILRIRFDNNNAINILWEASQQSTYTGQSNSFTRQRNVMASRSSTAMIGMHTTAVVLRGDEMYCRSYGYKCWYFVSTLHHVLSVQCCMMSNQVGLTSTIWGSFWCINNLSNTSGRYDNQPTMRDVRYIYSVAVQNPNSQKWSGLDTQMDHSKDNLLLPLHANCEVECNSGMQLLLQGCIVQNTPTEDDYTCLSIYLRAKNHLQHAHTMHKIRVQHTHHTSKIIIPQIKHHTTL